MKLKSIHLALAAGLLMNSSTVAPLAAQESRQTVEETSVIVGELLESLFVSWRQAYQQTQPSFRLNHGTTPNMMALKAFMDGKTPFTLSTRELSPEEVSAFTARWGYPPRRIAGAMDAVVVLANKNNPIKELRMEQLDAMYSSKRLRGWPAPVETWGDLGLTASDWVKRPIERWGHPADSGTLVFFRHVVELDAQERPDIKRGSDVAYMIETIMANQAAIGYGSFSNATASLKAIPLISPGAKTAVEPTPATIADASYPLGRFLYIYLNKPTGKELNPAIKGFLKFILSREGQGVVPAAGFVSLPQDLAGLGLRQL
ncbi:PstS family phosphate ABC transporter substrate-binding protein [Holophaga foetida]|uniref:PstS family phosphate ABC transporter substrate-binding protein n=1 Tax=Holophaga foetida TaxID=35839 RepID=UPI0002474D7C|nr:substrate-binding domain-containing protein [Holophaga foetida]